MATFEEIRITVQDGKPANPATIKERIAKLRAAFSDEQPRLFDQVHVELPNDQVALGGVVAALQATYPGHDFREMNRSNGQLEDRLPFAELSVRPPLPEEIERYEIQSNYAGIGKLVLSDERSGVLPVAEPVHEYI